MDEHLFPFESLPGPHVAEVIPLEGTLGPLTYAIPNPLSDAVKVGCMVKIPILRLVCCGIVCRLGSEQKIPRARLREIMALVHPFPVVTEPLLSLAQWISRYYLAPLSAVFETMLPAPVRQGVREAGDTLVERAQTIDPKTLEKLRKRSPKQAQIYDFLNNQTQPLPRSLVLSRLKISPSSLDALIGKGIVR